MGSPNVASAYRWVADGSVGWLVQAPGAEPVGGEAESREAANEAIMDRVRAAGASAVIITARHPNEVKHVH